VNNHALILLQQIQTKRFTLFWTCVII